MLTEPVVTNFVKSHATSRCVLGRQFLDVIAMDKINIVIAMDRMKAFTEELDLRLQCMEAHKCEHF